MDKIKALKLLCLLEDVIIHAILNHLCGAYCEFKFMNLKTHKVFVRVFRKSIFLYWTVTEMCIFLSAVIKRCSADGITPTTPSTEQFIGSKLYTLHHIRIGRFSPFFIFPFATLSNTIFNAYFLRTISSYTFCELEVTVTDKERRN